MKNEQFNGYKTPGGVYMYLVKHCEDFSKAEVRKVFKEEKKYRRDMNKIKSHFDVKTSLGEK